DVETTFWRAVCGRTARTVRRAGRVKALPDPYRGIDVMLVTLTPDFYKFHKSAAAGPKNGRSDQKRNFWDSVWKSAVLGFRISL
ncbi:MAG: hypothetical protein AB1Z29_27935, partial [Desulfobacterales bacterium]